MTAAKLGEQSLRDNEATMHLALQAGRLATWRWDLRADQIIAGGSSSDVFGYAPGMVLPSSAVTDRIFVEDQVHAREATSRGIEARRDFYIEYRFVGTANQLEWLGTHVRPVFDADGVPAYLIGVSQIITDRKRAEEHRQLLINELNHRVKNTLAVVLGIAQQSFRDERVPVELRRAFEGRLIALSAAHNVLTRENWEAAPLRQIITDAVNPFGIDRFIITGTDLRIVPKAAVSLALAFHELATNAAKYGSLSLETGQVAICWNIRSDDRQRYFDLLWEERGGPVVAPPTRQGFGTRMIERGLAAELDGEARINYVPSGVRCEISTPIERLQE